MVARDNISPKNETFYNTVISARNNPDIPKARSCYLELLNLVDDFLDTFKYPSVKEFWVGLTPVEKAIEGHDEAKMIEAMNNHPTLIDLNERLENHLTSKNYEDAATNMRLIVEYMVGQYVQQSAPDLYLENLATRTSELLRRNIINLPTKEAYDRIRKLGNALGAHLTGEKVNVDEVRECYYLLLKLKYDFLEVFNRPSNKEIPLQYTLMKNDSRIHHVEEKTFPWGKREFICYKDGTAEIKEYFNSPEDKKRIMEKRKQERLELDEKVKKDKRKDSIKGIIITSLLLTPVLLLLFAARYNALALTIIAYCIYGYIQDGFFQKWEQEEEKKRRKLSSFIIIPSVILLLITHHNILLLIVIVYVFREEVSRYKEYKKHLSGKAPTAKVTLYWRKQR